MTGEEFNFHQKLLQKITQKAVKTCLLGIGADVIMASGEGILTTTAMAGVLPIGSIPLGWAKSTGCGLGLEVMAPNSEEGKILRLMSAWEHMRPDAVKPSAVLEHSSQYFFRAEP
ncbi:hypothetical protein BS50DRAFT_301430 [Corynespora cassiicola Philippines]|uniref:Amidase domain-containing protein n=1 Tax=Corynespora cassiicola Philippines TaxID=1448308 RepID=A0A2T2NX15_CORCC|nr:hypothetical protein BS50DRAFT_301430 [Corynespora cassiicola Philippines]